MLSYFLGGNVHLLYFNRIWIRFCPKKTLIQNMYLHANKTCHHGSSTISKELTQWKQTFFSPEKKNV